MAFAQGIFIESSVSWKVITTKHPDNKPPVISTFFKLEPVNFIGPERFSPLFIGLNIGYQLKNKDALQLSIQQDGAAEGFLFYTTEKVQGSSSNYSYEKTGFVSGPSYTSIGLLYKRAILNMTSSYFNKGKFILVHFNFGFNYSYKPNNGYELQSSMGKSFIAPDSSSITLSAKQYVYPVSVIGSFKYNFGLSLSIGKYDKEWFILNAGYVYSRNAVHSKMKIDIDIAHNANKQSYYYSISNGGNGFYFGISKRIYPVKLYKRLEAKRLVKYEQLKNYI